MILLPDKTSLADAEKLIPLYRKWGHRKKDNRTLLKCLYIKKNQKKCAKVCNEDAK